MRSYSSLVMALTCALVMVIVPQVFAKRYIVGGNKGWSPNVNYTVWASDKHFYFGDWLCNLSLSLLISFFPLFFIANLFSNFLIISYLRSVLYQFMVFLVLIIN